MQNMWMMIYRRLLKHFGHRHWWPGDTPLEVMIGAILTQNTAWTNVEKAILNIKKAKALNTDKLLALSHARVARMLRPSGYFNIKTKRLKSFLRFYKDGFAAQVTRMKREDLPGLRKQLLAVKGVGPETADSILLYALEKPVFVVDAYTKRIFSRLGLIRPDLELAVASSRIERNRLFSTANLDYHDVQAVFMKHLKQDTALFNDYHAQIVQLGKEICKKTKPRCPVCPLGDLCRYALQTADHPVHQGGPPAIASSADARRRGSGGRVGKV